MPFTRISPAFARGLAAWLLGAVSLLAAKEAAPRPDRRGPSESANRLREGSKLTDVVGRMELTGDRTTFTPSDSSEAFRILENLSLERVNHVLGDSRDKPLWEISGVVTEFRGSNYLLLTRAVIKSTAPSATAPLPRPGR